jgi:hypothetical protein
MSNKLRESNHFERAKSITSATTDRNPTWSNLNFGSCDILGTEDVEGIRGISTQKNSSS